ncbi:MAG: spermidine/putrescine ABC transporter substrate-binding protein [Elusimicrobia bacterium]|nr:spermidine/putrescine ABC transporter substrate-binding protein [Elusimicrobiota bacterium]MDE2425463.1 spermidine/putrescine ABC transporter substrate-binding protein [Elusimicrobiota bacterium]
MPEPKLTRRQFLALSAVAAAAPAAFALQACDSGSEERVVNFFNWSKYIGPDTLSRFTRRTGIRVNYEEFSDEEAMFAKLRSGARGYDLAIGADYMISRFKGLNLIDPFPSGALRNIGNIDPRFRKTPYDPQDAYTVPYLWGTTGIGFNRQFLPRAPQSWRDLWDPRYQGKISMLDNSRDCVSTALLMLGYPETADDAQLEQAKKLLLSQRPLVKQYNSSTYMDSLITGDVLLAMGWSGDILQACREKPQLDYAIPREGSYLWVDNLILVRGSRHRADTLRLVDYLLEPETAAGIADAVRYATPNRAAMPLLDKSLREDPRVFPGPELSKRLRFHQQLDPATVQAWNELWSDVKVG